MNRLANDEAADLSLAGIDSQDPVYSEPLRQYFLTHGCRVEVNSPLKLSPQYQVVCGEREYVKGIISDLPDDERRLLILVWDLADQFMVHGRPVSTVIVSGQTLTAADVQAIFAYFFTGNQQVLRLQEPQVIRKTDETYRSKEALRATDEARIANLVQETYVTSAKVPQAIKGKSFRRVGIAAGTIFMFSAPFLYYFLLLVLAVTGIRLDKLQLTRVSADSARQMLKIIAPAVTAIGGGEGLRIQEEMLTVLSRTAEVGAEAQALTVQATELGAEWFAGYQQGGGGSVSLSRILRLRAGAGSILAKTGFIQASGEKLADYRWPIFDGLIKQKTRSALSRLGSARNRLVFVDRLLQVYAGMAGFAEKKVYLLLFQNSLELRPTGGFIGSLGQLTLENGAVSELVIRDVYETDGQLKGHVDPPGPVRELLNQEHWYLRDSNWDPDFEKSGATAAWFYQKETGIQVDGVIGVSVPLVVELMKITGPVDLSDYNDRITAENFYGKSIYYTQENFFPGSTQKRDFLGSLTTALLARLTGAKGADPLSVLAALQTAADGYDLQFYFTDPALERMVNEYDWAGKIFPVAGCGGGDNCLDLPAGVNEANFSVSKVNYYVKRATSREIVVEESGSLKERIEVNFQNMSNGQPEQGGGNYRTYVRFLLPSDSVVEEVAVNGQTVMIRPEKEKTLPALPYVEMESGSAGYRVVGVALDVPAGDRRQLSLTAARAANRQTGGSRLTLALFQQKQAGVVGEPLRLVVRYPASWILETSLPWQQTFLAKEVRLEYNTTLSRNLENRILFRK